MATNKQKFQTSEALMQQAINLAKRGAGFVKTNPMVGALLVHNNEIIAQGYHARFGTAHAEIKVLQSAKKKNINKRILKNSTLYSTLEPCSRKNKTPACVDAIIKSGIKHVVIGSKDPNPNEKGRAIRILRKAGINVTVGVAKADTNYLIRTFRKWITTKEPFVLGKVGMSLDSKVTHPAFKRYITNNESINKVHHLRQEFDAILAGVNTVIRDDPQLNVRLPQKRINHPYKIILDSRLRTPPKSKLLDNKTILVCVEGTPLEKRKALSRTGADILEIPPMTQRNQQLFERLDIEKLLKVLGEKGISSIIVEGGSYVFTTFINRMAIDEFYIFMAPYLFGATQLPFTYALKHGITLEDVHMEQLSDNMLVRGYVKYDQASNY